MMTFGKSKKVIQLKRLNSRYLIKTIILNDNKLSWEETVVGTTL